MRKCVHDIENSGICRMYTEIKQRKLWNHLVTKPLYFIVPHVALLYRCVFKGRPKGRAVLGGDTAACVLWSLDHVHMHMLLRHHSVTIFYAVIKCMCIPFLVYSCIATCSMGCRIPSRY